MYRRYSCKASFAIFCRIINIGLQNLDRLSRPSLFMHLLHYLDSLTVIRLGQTSRKGFGGSLSGLTPKTLLWLPTGSSGTGALCRSSSLHNWNFRTRNSSPSTELFARFLFIYKSETESALLSFWHELLHFFSAWPWRSRNLSRWFAPPLLSFLHFSVHLMGQTWWWAGLIWSRDLILYPVGLLYVAALWPPPRRILITCHSSFADPSNQDATKYLPRMFVMMARSTHLNSTTTEAVEGPKPELTLFDNFVLVPPPNGKLDRWHHIEKSYDLVFVGGTTSRWKSTSWNSIETHCDLHHWENQLSDEFICTLTYCTYACNPSPFHNLWE